MIYWVFVVIINYAGVRFESIGDYYSTFEECAEVAKEFVPNEYTESIDCKPRIK